MDSVDGEDSLSKALRYREEVVKNGSQSGGIHGVSGLHDFGGFSEGFWGHGVSEDGHPGNLHGSPGLHGAGRSNGSPILHGTGAEHHGAVVFHAVADVSPPCRGRGRHGGHGGGPGRGKRPATKPSARGGQGNKAPNMPPRPSSSGIVLGDAEAEAGADNDYTEETMDNVPHGMTHSFRSFSVVTFLPLRTSKAAGLGWDHAKGTVAAPDEYWKKVTKLMVLLLAHLEKMLEGMMELVMYKTLVTHR
uniref:Uncharacterized protein n=1 Tax=Oryza brachyantha TaxID=4533 RepID=J3N1D7_ORYBR